VFFLSVIHCPSAVSRVSETSGITYRCHRRDKVHGRISLPTPHCRSWTGASYHFEDFVSCVMLRLRGGFLVKFGEENKNIT
jgi:hypothetical protein